MAACIALRPLQTLAPKFLNRWHSLVASVAVNPDRPALHCPYGKSDSVVSEMPVPTFERCLFALLERRMLPAAVQSQGDQSWAANWLPIESKPSQGWRLGSSCDKKSTTWGLGRWFESVSLNFEAGVAHAGSSFLRRLSLTDDGRENFAC